MARRARARDLIGAVQNSQFSVTGHHNSSNIMSEVPDVPEEDFFSALAYRKPCGKCIELQKHAPGMDLRVSSSYDCELEAMRASGGFMGYEDFSQPERLPCTIRRRQSPSPCVFTNGIFKEKLTSARAPNACRACSMITSSHPA